MLQVIFILNLIHSSINYSILGMSQEQQYETFSLQILPNSFQQDSYFALGVWTQYAPLDRISQVGNIGIFDSNCFNIHNARDSSSNQINFLYFDCIDTNTQLITKSIKFLTDEGNQVNFQTIIDNYQYEFNWFYFQFTQWPMQRKLELIIIQSHTMVMYKMLDITQPYQSQDLILIFGGGLSIDEHQLLDTNNQLEFSYFPGKMFLYPLELYQMSIETDRLQYIIDGFQFQYDCKCFQDFFLPISRNFVDQDFLIYTSSETNCDKFTLNGWIRIIDIKQKSENFTYQFIKMCSNSENSKILNQNLCAFQLFYVISQNSYKIIFTTYSYQLPLINQDYSSNQNLIQKEFEISDITLWHFIKLNLNKNIFTFKINIFQSQNNQIFLFEENVNHFHLVQFKFLFGNLLQLQEDNLSITVYNFTFNNCISSNTENICDSSCQTCDGPHKTDCLSCDSIQGRVYIPQEQKCVCSYDSIDDQMCKTYSDYNLQINPTNSEKTQKCRFGQFQIDNGDCFECPTIQKKLIITCQECALNPQNWINNPYCRSYLALDQIGSPFQIIVEDDIKYFFDGERLNIRFVDENADGEIQNNYKNFLIHQQRFREFCSESSSQYDIQKIQRDQCYSCGSISNCLRCYFTTTGSKCLECDYDSSLNNGICTPPQLVGGFNYNTCQSPYYINSNKGCSLCSIQNCIYCFEYLRDDLTFCTLYSGFAQFDQVESHSVGCALCKDNYIYDFTKGQCIQSISNIPNCSRSFINLQGQEVCTLANIDDFTIAPEIEYCQRYISKCQQCIQTPQQKIKCIICQDNYTASISSGQCYPCILDNAKFCIEGNYIKLDAWIQLIQSFMMQFLPNRYFYSQSGPFYQIASLAIQCQEGYLKTITGICTADCDQNCLQCQQQASNNYKSACLSCGLDYYGQPVRSSIQGICFTCQQLCEICIPRTEDEIQIINSNFILNEENKIFTYKCLKKVNDANIILDPYLMHAKYCFDEECNSDLEINIEAICANLYIITVPYLGQYYEDQINVNFCNQMGIQKLSVNFSFKLYSQTENCDFTTPTSISSNLKQKIFTLQILECNIQGTQTLDNVFYNSLIIENYDSINLANLNLQAPSKNFSLIFLNSQSLLDLQFQNLIFFSIDLTQFFQISAPNSLIENFKAYNITLINLIVQNSIIFNLNVVNFQIDLLNIYNCTFINTVIINIINSSYLQISNITVSGSQFFNSTFFMIKQNQINHLSFELSKMILTSAQFENSTIFQNIQDQQSEYSNFLMSNILVYDNIFSHSIFLLTNKNITMATFELQNNTISNTILFLTDSIKKEDLLFIFEGWILFSNIFSNSTIIQITQNYKISIIIYVFVFNNTQLPINQNEYLFQIQAINLTVQNFYMFDSYNIKVFYLQQTSLIQFNDIVIKNPNKLFKINQQLECYPYIDYIIKFLHVAGFSNLSLFNFDLSELFSFDQSLIQILSDILFNPNTKENIKFQNISISNSVILKQSLGNLLSLIAIFSEQIQEINFYNLTFTQNTFHQYIDDPSQTSAGLVYIGSQQSQISIDLLFSDSNHLTNSTHSFFIFLSQTIQICNFLIQNHNYKNDDSWIKIYNFNQDNLLSQDQIYFIIQSIFTIQNIGGAFSITTASFILKDGQFSKIVAESSATLDIKTQGVGEVVLKNLNFSDISVDLSQFVELSSCINIYSKNSLLNLQMVDASFLFVFNSLGSAILSVVPSQKQNVIIMKNIKLENCISLINTLTKIEFQENNKFSNNVKIENLQVNVDLDGQLNFFKSLGIFAIEDISQIKNDNALINLKGCVFIFRNGTISGVFSQAILQLQSIDDLSLYAINIFSIEQLYSSNLIVISQTRQKMKVKLSNFCIKNTTLKPLSTIKNLIQSIQYELDTNNQGCQFDYNVKFSYEKNNSMMNFFESLNSEAGSNLTLINFYSSSAQINILFYKITLQQNSQSNLDGCYFEFANDLNLRITEFKCFYNSFFENGCLIFQSQPQEIKNSQILVKSSNFFSNAGGNGVGIFSKNYNLAIINCKFIHNNSTNKGGAIYFDGKNQTISISATLITNNSANYGGGVFINGVQHFTQQNFVKSYLLFNEANIFANNLNEQPLFLQLSINHMQMKSIQIGKNNTFIQSSQILPYRVLQQGRVVRTNYILFPSGQTISGFQLFNPKQQKYFGYINELSLSFRNSFGEEIMISSNSSCSIQQNIYSNNTVQKMTFFEPIYRNSQTQRLNLESLSITFDPFILNDQFTQLQVSCPTDDNINQLIYYLNSRSFLCQLGEFYIDEGCEECQSNQGFYSVQYNVTKCSIFDKTKFKTITSNQIELLPGFWRPNLLSDSVELCFKEENFCIGGWEIGDQLCSIGHIGGLCEECDIYNIRGDGKFFRSLKNLDCNSCSQISSSLWPFILSCLWSLLSIALTLRSVEISNKLYTSLRLRQKYFRILFKLNYDHESILLKMLINYLWIFSVIFTFNIDFQISLNFADQAANPIQFMTNNLDCYLSEAFQISIIYSKVMFMIILILLELLLITLIQKIISVIRKKKIDKSIISTTAIYLFVSNHASLIKNFCSLLSKRTISEVDYIQGNVSFLYNTLRHKIWMLGFILPGLGICGLLIPIGLFLTIFVQRKKLDEIKIRKYICYLFNEYNQSSYFWEQIKIWQKTVIIIILTYYETEILPKVAFLGISLLFYQKLATKQQPYNISSLNKVDVGSVQICSFAIFLASIAYSYQQDNLQLALIIQIIIILLFIRLCFPFLNDAFRVYYKKYKITFVSNIVTFLKKVKITSSATYILTRKLSVWKEKQILLKNNVEKLRYYLISISKVQLEQQRVFTSQLSPLTSVRSKQNSREYETKKIIRFEL